MEAIASPKFAKALLGFAISMLSTVMMTIVTAILISTGEATSLCVTFAIIAIASIASTIYFMHKMVESTK